MSNKLKKLAYVYTSPCFILQTVNVNLTNIFLSERESAFIAHMQREIRCMHARNTHSSKAESRAKRRMRKRWRRNGDRANGRLQVQPVYIARTTDSRRSMADVRARCRVHDRQGEAHQFPIQFTRPVFRTLTSTHLPTPLVAHAATREDRFRVRQVFR